MPHADLHTADMSDNVSYLPRLSWLTSHRGGVCVHTLEMTGYVADNENTIHAGRSQHMNDFSCSCLADINDINDPNES
jgi:hypothetical protein